MSKRPILHCMSQRLIVGICIRSSDYRTSAEPIVEKLNPKNNSIEERFNSEVYLSKKQIC